MTNPAGMPPPRLPGVPDQAPGSGPSATEIENARIWQKMVAASAESVVASAEKWRTGLAALVTLLSGGLVLAGPKRDEIDGAWWYLSAVLFVAGLTCAGVGFLIALVIAAGRPARTNLQRVEAQWGSVRVWLLRRSITQVRWVVGIEALAAATLLFMIGGSAVWLLSPEPAPKPVITVSTTDNKVCGELQSADGQTYVIKVPGNKEPQEVEFADVLNVKVSETCG